MYKYALFTLILFFSCSKIKQHENFLEGHSFLVTISVDGSTYYLNEKFKFETCNNKKEFCIGSWINDVETTEFYWQFSNRGKTFELSNKTATDGSNQLAVKCYEISGKYSVKKKGKEDGMMLESNEAIGYYGKKVILNLIKS